MVCIVYLLLDNSYRYNAVGVENVSLNGQIECESVGFGVLVRFVGLFAMISSMNKKLNERVILITGGGTGIGRATAIACAKEGMKVAVSGRRLEKLLAVVAEIEAVGGQGLAVVCDVQDEKEVRGMFEQVLSKFEKLDVLFANAGYSLEADVCETESEQVKDIFETNFMGTFYAVKHGVDAFEKSGGVRGRHVVICSSSLSHFSVPKFGIYSATKAAQLSMAQSLRVELGREGGYVSTVHPVGTESELVVSDGAGEKRTITNSNTPKLFIQSCERVADCVVRCLKRPKRAEVWPSFITWPLFCVFHSLPRFAGWLMGRVKG